MKNKLLIISLLTSFSFNNLVFAQGVPVIDGTNIANQIKQWSTELEQYTETFKNAQDQLKTQANQLAATTGIRDIQAFMNQAQGILGQVDDLSKWMNKQDDIMKHGKDILSADLKSIFNSYGLTNKCESLPGQQKKNCEGEIIVDVVKQQNNTNNLKQLEKRINTIQGISKRMESSKDQKESMDLANAMNTQMTLLQADKVKMDIQQSMDESQLRLLKKQEEDRHEKTKNTLPNW